MEPSKFVREEVEEEEEKWSSNETGWTKFFESYGNGFGSAGCYNKEADGGIDEIVEDDDSLASDASSGPPYFDQSCIKRSEDNEVMYEVEEDRERQEREKKKLCMKDKRKEKEKEKRRNFFKL